MLSAPSKHNAHEHENDDRFPASKKFGRYLDAAQREPVIVTKKNRILLDNYYLPGDLRRQIDAFVDHYNHRRYHESLQNLTPADVYFGRGQTILKQRERNKRKTIETRRLLHRKSAA